MKISPSEPSLDPNEVNSQLPGKPWGVALTLVFSAVIVIIYLFASGIAIGVLLVLTSPQNPQINFEAQLANLKFNGLMISVATVAGSLVASGLIILAAVLRRGLTLADYLCFKPVSLSVFSRWLVPVAILLAFCDLSNWLLGRPLVPPFMVQAYATAGSRSLFFLAIVVAAPVVEEIFFRGFVFAGLAQSRLGTRWTIAITAVAWASIHTQYELYDILQIVLIGVIYGMARWKTGSIYTTMVLHALTNLAALIEVWLLAPVRI